MRRTWIAPLLIVAMLIFSVVVYPTLPETIPSHWNIYGDIDGYLPKLPGVLMLPAIAAVIWLIFLSLPYLDPKREHYAQFKHVLPNIGALIVGLLALIHVLTLGVTLGWQVDAPRIILAAVGLVFIAIGREMPRVTAQNYFVGIRTPWTLDDPEVWRRTHNVGGRMFLIGGVVAVIGTLILPVPFGIAALLAGALGASGGSIVYSWWVYRQLHAPHA